jgi:hypothetical protein
VKANKAKCELTPATERAVEVVTSLLHKWDDSLIDNWFIENMDLDQPRQERKVEIQRLTSGKSWTIVQESKNSEVISRTRRPNLG